MRRKAAFADAPRVHDQGSETRPTPLTQGNRLRSPRPSGTRARMNPKRVLRAQSKPNRHFETPHDVDRVFAVADDLAVRLVRAIAEQNEAR